MDWRRRIYGLAGALFMVCVGAPARAETDCLTSDETQDAISQRIAITPNAALKAARFHLPQGEALRARLCHHNDSLAYWVTVLGRNGKVTRVLIKALDGTMIEMR
ncbi:MAG: hypothetical protein ACRCXM_13750 [Beijerinckiaceae bacterium]